MTLLGAGVVKREVELTAKFKHLSTEVFTYRHTVKEWVGQGCMADLARMVSGPLRSTRVWAVVREVEGTGIPPSNTH